MHFKMSSAKWRPFCLDLNVLTILHKVSIEDVSIGSGKDLVAVRRYASTSINDENLGYSQLDWLGFIYKKYYA